MFRPDRKEPKTDETSDSRDLLSDEMSMTASDSVEPLPYDTSPSESREPLPYDMSPAEPREPHPEDVQNVDLMDTRPDDVSDPDPREPLPFDTLRPDQRAPLGEDFRNEELMDVLPDDMSPLDPREPLRVGIWRQDPREPHPVGTLRPDPTKPLPEDMSHPDSTETLPDDLTRLDLMDVLPDDMSPSDARGPLPAESSGPASKEPLSFEILRLEKKEPLPDAMLREDLSEPISDESDSSFIIIVGQKPTSARIDASMLDGVVPVENSEFPQSVESMATSSRHCVGKKTEDQKMEACQPEETPSQSISSLKSQLSNFLTQQKDVLKISEGCKEVFSKSRKMIVNLCKENASMKKLLGEMKVEPGLLTGEMGESVDPEKSLKDASVVLKVWKDLFTQNEYLAGVNKKLFGDCQNEKTEKAKLLEELEEVRNENSALQKTNESLTSKFLPDEDGRAQINNLFKELGEEKEKNLRLQEDLEKAEMKIEQQNVTEKINRCVDKLLEISRSLEEEAGASGPSAPEDNPRETQADKGVECDLFLDMVQPRMEEIAEENAMNEERQSIGSLKTDFTRLLSDYQILERKFDSFSYECQHTEELQLRISSLMEELAIKDQKLMAKQKECDALRKELKTLKQDWGERINALELQAEVYKTDFKCERNVKEKILEEKEALEEKVENLKKVLKNLGHQTPEKNTELESPGKTTIFKCPNCLGSFRDLETCEQHYCECLNIQFC